MLAPPQSSSRSEAPQLFAWRAVLLFCAPMLVNGIIVLYFPVLLQDLKMSDIEIGIITSIPALMRIVGMPIGAMAADRVSDRTIVLVWSGVVSLVTTIMMFYTHAFWPLALAYGLQSFFYAPFVPIADAILVTGVRRWAFDYGSLRLWGSVAFAVATMIGGWLLDIFGGAMVLPCLTVFYILTVAMALTAPRLGRQGAETPADPVAAVLAKTSFWEADFLLVIVGASIVMASQVMVYAFATNYWTAQGMSGFEISFLWLAGVAAEIGLFFVSGRWLGRYSVWTLLIVGSLVTMVRWALFPLVSGFWPYLLLQFTHAFTYAIIHLGVQRFMIGRVADGRGASAQGFYQAANSIFSVMAGWAAGYIFQAYGVYGFFSMSILAIIGLITILAAMWVHPQRARSGG